MPILISRYDAPHTTDITANAHQARRLMTSRRETARRRGSSAAGQDHDQPVDPDPDAAGGRHALLERLHERLVVGLGLVVARGRVAALVLEAARAARQGR